MRFTLRTDNTCAKVIEFDLENGNIVKNIVFHGGCSGNLKAIQKLVDGYTVTQINEKLSGITCGERKTSCSDQLAKLVRQAAEQEKN
ncbi:MAG: TIGR03905 family TSCPD domain-containing protein [Lachnospiraceae bacterium]|nr:TIGR03905 family TSCPD domain-containing protein [Lachnospiraceae bacterium]